MLLPRQRSKLARGANDEEHAMSQNLNSAVAVIGIDIGKNSFHIVGLDSRGAIVLRQKWSRGQVEARLANMPPCLIGMEACVGAHHLSRELKALGHDARLMPAKCRGDCRGGAAADDEVRGDEDGRAARPAGAAPCTRTTGQPAHWHHQSDPRLPAGARCCRAAGPAVLARRVASRPGDTTRCAVAPHGAGHRGPGK